MNNKNSESKKTFWSLVIIVIMGVSVLSYAFMSVFGNTNSQTYDEISSYVLENNISEATRQYYVQQGLTFMEVHYDASTDMVSIEALPNELLTSLNEIQLIVIEMPDYDRQYAVFSSLQGTEEVNSTDVTELTEAACRMLTYTPVNCVFDEMDGNATSIVTNTSSSQG